jgi:hypothetical protein
LEDKNIPGGFGFPSIIDSSITFSVLTLIIWPQKIIVAITLVETRIETIRNMNLFFSSLDFHFNTVEWSRRKIRLLYLNWIPFFRKIFPFRLGLLSLPYNSHHSMTFLYRDIPLRHPRVNGHILRIYLAFSRFNCRTHKL